MRHPGGEASAEDLGSHVRDLGSSGERRGYRHSDTWGCRSVGGAELDPLWVFCTWTLRTSTCLHGRRCTSKYVAVLQRTHGKSRRTRAPVSAICVNCASHTVVSGAWDASFLDHHERCSGDLKSVPNMFRTNVLRTCSDRFHCAGIYTRPQTSADVCRPL